MYHYLPFKIIDVDKKKYYLDIITIAESYLFKKEDNVKNSFIKELINTTIADEINGYLILDTLGYKQIIYLSNYLKFEYVDELNTSIFDKLAKQIVYYE